VLVNGRELAGDLDATVVSGDAPDAYNDVDFPDRVVPVRTRLTATRGAVSLPPHSLNVVEVQA